jgi:hypothetical protein
MFGAHPLFRPVFLPISSTYLYRLWCVWHTRCVYTLPRTIHSNLPKSAARVARRINLTNYVMERACAAVAV